MASFSHQKVADFLVAFLEQSNGKEEMNERTLAAFLENIGYAAEPQLKQFAAKDLILTYDFSCSGVLCFEDFLLAMEHITNEVDSFRNYLESSLKYFCRRKLEQHADSGLSLDDMTLFMGRLTKTEMRQVVADFEKDIKALFKPKSNNDEDENGSDSLSVLGPFDRRSRQSLNSNRDTSNKKNQSQKSLRGVSGQDEYGDSGGPIGCPEGTLIEIIINRMCPRPQIPILYEVCQGHLSQQIGIQSLIVRSVNDKLRAKVQTYGLHYTTVQPIFVVCSDDEVVYSQPLNEYNWQGESSEHLFLDLTLPSLRSDEIMRWIDETDVTLSVFDYNEAGVTPWAEWIGTARCRLSWFISRMQDSAPMSCRVDLHTVSPKFKYQTPPFIEFTITIPTMLIQLWHTFRQRGGIHPDAISISDAIKKTLPASVEVFKNNNPGAFDATESIFEEDDNALLLADQNFLANSKFDVYAYWRRRRTSFRTRFPRRRVNCVAKDEYANFHLLPCFVHRIEGLQLDSPEKCLETVAALDTGPIGHCDAFQSPFKQEIITSPALVLASGKATALEAAILLCGMFLGLGQEAYVCISESDTPWVVTVHDLLATMETPTRELENSTVTVSRDVLGGIETGKRGNRMRQAQFVRSMESKRVKADRKRCFIQFWNPVTGAFFKESDPQSPRCVDCLFNDVNVWFNVQRSNSVVRMTWRTITGPMQDTTQWEPLLASSILSKVRLVKVYSLPDFSVYPSIASRHSFHESKVLLADIVDAISMYRQHKLFIPDTRFDGKLSLVLNEELVQVWRMMKKANALSLDEFRQEGFPLECDKAPPPSEIMNALPGHTLWNGSIYTFHTTNVQEIMMRLEEMGILNNSVPNVQYAVAVQVFPLDFGLSNVWLYVGTLQDIDTSLTFLLSTKRNQ